MLHVHKQEIKNVKLCIFFRLNCCMSQRYLQSLQSRMWKETICLILYLTSYKNTKIMLQKVLFKKYIFSTFAGRK